MPAIIRRLLIALFVVAIYFKAFKLSGINVYVLIAAALALVLVIQALLAHCLRGSTGSPRTGQDPFALSLSKGEAFATLLTSHCAGPGIYLSFFGLFVVVQLLFLPGGAYTKTVLITIAIVLTYHTLATGLLVTRLDLKPFFMLAVALSLASTALLLLQVHVSLERFDPIPPLARLGLVRDYVSDIPGYTEALADRGRGFAASIGEYTVHNFLPLFFLALTALRVEGTARLLYFLALVVFFAGFVASGSEIFNLAAVAAVVAYLITRWSRGLLTGQDLPRVRWLTSWSIIVGITLVFILVCATVPYFLSKIDWSGANTLTQRVYYWAVALGMFIENPATGIGLGHFKGAMLEFSPLFDVFPWRPSPAEVHSLPLMVLSGTGVVGFLVYFGFVLGSLGAAYRNVMRAVPTVEDKVIFLTLFALLVQSLFGNHFVILDIYVVSALAQYRCIQLRGERWAIGTPGATKTGAASPPREMPTSSSS